ncbi:NAD(+) diphosphatase [Loktanella sp. S4079]|uniref:NAD(+) diphosphatase n=1 Tax=Loktanella sp. S4079 TaxID=579483 RepID=UPI0005F9ECC9|nr:NAD(+) diphosphatase [Loktanella sp. S4079]KJZ20718.1 NUDIX hydrolase [Loktanella sp. S4079]
MKIAETVTFGGSGLDRAAHLRAKAPDLLTDSATQVLLLWRGKPMLQAGTLVRVPYDHPVLQDASRGLIFLGLDEGPVFAADLSSWTPKDVDAEALNSFADASEQHHPAMPSDAAFVELRTVMSSLSARDAELAATARAVFGWHRSHRFCALCGNESEFAMGGWQRDCPSCGGHHFPRTDPVVIMLITRGNAVLMGRSPGWPDGMYSLLAGFVEPGETIEAAVRREVLEEAGIQVGPVRYLASQPWPFPSSLMSGCAGEATSEEITIDPAEIEDARWVTREEIALSFTGHHPDILPARKGAIARFLLENWLADRLD